MNQILTKEQMLSEIKPLATKAVVKEVLKKPVEVKPFIGQLVTYFINGDGAFTEHPAIVLKVYETGAVKLNIFMDGFMSMVDKVPVVKELIDVKAGVCRFLQKI